MRFIALVEPRDGKEWRLDLWDNLIATNPNIEFDSPTTINVPGSGQKLKIPPSDRVAWFVASSSRIGKLRLYERRRGEHVILVYGTLEGMSELATSIANLIGGQVRILPQRQIKSSLSQLAFGVSDFDTELVPWFKSIGSIETPFEGVERIYCWDDWLGPEQVFRASYCVDPPVGLENLWRSVYDRTLNLVESVVPYDEAADEFFAPNAAAHHAAHLAASLACCAQLSIPAEGDLAKHYQVFLSGHWPCGAKQRQQIVF